MASAVCHFHSGAAGRLKAMEKLNIRSGASIKQALLAKTRSAYKSLICRQLQKKGNDIKLNSSCTPVVKKLHEAEGVTYEARGF